MVDSMVLTRLTELAMSLGTGINSTTTNTEGSKYELFFLYDADVLDSDEQVTHILKAGGFDVLSSGLQLFGISFEDFIAYPNVKPVKLSKSHDQHLAYTTWWNRHGKPDSSPEGQLPWRFVWCMEHDVAVTGGDWRMVFDGHLAPRKLDLDFVSQKVGFSTKVSLVHGGGAWNLNLRNGMLSRVKAEEVAVHFGPLVRFSVKLIDHIHEMSLEGATGHSEVTHTCVCTSINTCA